MKDCINIMCKYNLNKDNVKKWIMINHPDKKDHPLHDNTISPTDYNKVVECYKEKIFCKSEKKSNNKKPKIAVTKKNRRKIFTCMRKIANFGKINNYHKFDKSVFNKDKLINDLNDASPKILQLLNNINELDKKDMQTHNKKFKHFIFSDVKEGGYGAKILASALIAFGFKNVIKARKVPGVQKLKLYIDNDLSKDGKNFGLLCSNSIYNSNFNEKLKKELLKLFNERPGNINGNKLRFIIFDSGFKEGIDLFDVKYVHIFEPSMTIADLKQTIGRATRTCGQKGLDFIPKVGWPLYVYNYYLTIPELTKDSFYANKFLAYNITNSKSNSQNSKNSKNEEDENILLFKDADKFNDATMLYSEFDKAMNKVSKQLFDLAPSLSVDYFLTKNLHEVDDLNHQFMEKDFYLMGGAKDVHKKINKMSKYYKIDLIKCKGKCSSRTTNDVPISVDFMKRVYKKYKHPNSLIPKLKQRQFFCQYMKNDDNKYCRQLNHEWSLRYAYIPEIIEKKAKNPKKAKEELNDIELDIDNSDEDVIDKDYSNMNYDGNKNASASNAHKKMSFMAMRDYIRSNYGVNKDYVWDPLVIENKCIPKPGEKPKAAHEIELNPTQKFITDYFTPQSPYKGLLLWHSVGTGKTCSGVSIASSSFEREGYTILWVTRTTLKGDVWKNIFDQICHSILREEVELGLTVPEKINERKKLLSDRWLEPMSYKQFSNLLIGKNKIYNILKERNGSNDILHKTLIIIDEAHKLYGGDLKAVEKPDTNIMEKLIMNSYKKSGQNSCKLLIMTATPFTNSPLELFSITNLFMTNESEKITTNKEEFKKQYMTSENILSDNGVKNLANKLSGYISYLNREKDPTQFSQPVMINVPVLMSSVLDNKLRDALYLKTKLENVSDEVMEQIQKFKVSIKQSKQKYKDLKQELNDVKKTKTDACKSKFASKEDKSKLKECLDSIKEELQDKTDELNELMEEIQNMQEQLDELEESKNDVKLANKEDKEKLKKLKASLLQEYMLFKKCMIIDYKTALNSNKEAKKTIKLLLKNVTKSRSKSEKNSGSSKKAKSKAKPKVKTSKAKAKTKNDHYNSYSN